MYDPIALAAELRKTQQQLRDTERDLGLERQRTAELTSRVQALLVHEGARRAEAAAPCGEILHTRPTAVAGSIDNWQETQDA